MKADSSAESIATCRALVASGMARTIRLDAHLSVREMSRAVGCSPAALFAWEGGKARVSAEYAPFYLRALRQLAKVGA